MQAQNMQAGQQGHIKQYVVIFECWEGASSSPGPLQDGLALGNDVRTRAKHAGNCLLNCHATNYLVNVTLHCWH
jgi:hypothetical protein